LQDCRYFDRALQHTATGETGRGFASLFRSKPFVASTLSYVSHTVRYVSQPETASVSSCDLVSVVLTSSAFCFHLSAATPRISARMALAFGLLEPTQDSAQDEHCGTVCCSVLQCVAVCCSVLQCRKTNIVPVLGHTHAAALGCGISLWRYRWVTNCRHVLRSPTVVTFLVRPQPHIGYLAIMFYCVCLWPKTKTRWSFDVPHSNR